LLTTRRPPAARHRLGAVRELPRAHDLKLQPLEDRCTEREPRHGISA